MNRVCATNRAVRRKSTSRSCECVRLNVGQACTHTSHTTTFLWSYLTCSYVKWNMPSNLPLLFALSSFAGLQILYLSRAGMMVPQIVSILWHPDYNTTMAGNVIDGFAEFHPAYSMVSAVRYAIIIL